MRALVALRSRPSTDTLAAALVGISMRIEITGDVRPAGTEMRWLGVSFTLSVT